MVTKELVRTEVLRTCSCVHCHTVLTEEAYSQWIGVDSLEGENLSQEELDRIKQDMQSDNLAWQAEADKAWELRVGEFLLAHSTCGLPIMTEEVKKEAKELHTQQTPPEVKVTEEKQTTQSQNISQEDTKMADQKEENTNATPKKGWLRRQADKVMARIEKLPTPVKVTGEIVLAVAGVYTLGKIQQKTDYVGKVDTFITKPFGGTQASVSTKKQNK